MRLLPLLLALFVPATSQVSESTFQRHSIATDLPGDANWGYGTPTLADYDGDGDLDFTVSSLVGEIYWFEQQGADEWTRHKLGDIAPRKLGATSLGRRPRRPCRSSRW